MFLYICFTDLVSEKNSEEDNVSHTSEALDELQQKLKSLERCSPQEMKSKGVFSGMIIIFICRYMIENEVAFSSLILSTLM